MNVCVTFAMKHFNMKKNWRDTKTRTTNNNTNVTTAKNLLKKETWQDTQMPARKSEFIVYIYKILSIYILPIKLYS